VCPSPGSQSLSQAFEQLGVLGDKDVERVIDTRTQGASVYVFADGCSGYVLHGAVLNLGLLPKRFGFFFSESQCHGHESNGITLIPLRGFAALSAEKYPITYVCGRM
jgi:hypothetical protein